MYSAFHKPVAAAGGGHFNLAHHAREGHEMRKPRNPDHVILPEAFEPVKGTTVFQTATSIASKWAGKHCVAIQGINVQPARLNSNPQKLRYEVHVTLMPGESKKLGPHALSHLKLVS